MAKNDSRTGQASSCHEVVAFDFDGMFESVRSKRTAGRTNHFPDNMPIVLRDTKAGGNKFIGVCPRKMKIKSKTGAGHEYDYWQVKIEIDGREKSTTRNTEIKAALQYDNWVRDYGLDRTTNYDLYREYWK